VTTSWSCQHQGASQPSRAELPQRAACGEGAWGCCGGHVGGVRCERTGARPEEIRISSGEGGASERNGGCGGDSGKAKALEDWQVGERGGGFAGGWGGGVVNAGGDKAGEEVLLCRQGGRGGQRRAVRETSEFCEHA
jgi:hypothetical protein